jgi:hypothetical protein
MEEVYLYLVERHCDSPVYILHTFPRYAIQLCRPGRPIRMKWCPELSLSELIFALTLHHDDVSEVKKCRASCLL